MEGWPVGGDLYVFVLLHGEDEAAVTPVIALQVRAAPAQGDAQRRACGDHGLFRRDG